MSDDEEKRKERTVDDRLERECHQRRVERNRQQQMTETDDDHWPPSDEVGDPPVPRDEVRSGEDDDGEETTDGEHERVLESLKDLRYLDEEVGELGFLTRRTPCHVDFEHVGDQGLGNVERQTTKEDDEHGNPFGVLPSGVEESLLADTVTHDSQGDVTETDEDDDENEPDLPRVEVVLVEVSVEPTDGEVVDNSEQPGGTDGVVGTDVGNNGNLGGETNVGDQELAEEVGERTTGEPETERVEEELVATVRVLFPTSKLIVDGERHTLLETLTSPGTHTNDVTVTLETKRHVEIFRDVGFGPELVVAVFILVRDLLDSLPAKNSVVTDERSDVTVGDSETNGRVNQVGEVGDTVFEESPDDLHDTGRELHDTDLGRLLHLGDGIQETILWNTGVGVDENDVVADTDITISPGTTMLVEDFLETATIGFGFIVLVPFGVAVDNLELLLDVARNHHTKVHVGGLLELSLTDEALGTVLGSGSPTDTVVSVKVDSFVALFLVNQLKTVVVEEHVARSSLEFVRGDGGLERLDCWHDDTLETLLVDGTLDGDVWKWATGDTAWKKSRVETRVGGDLLDRTDHLSGTTNNDLGKELRESADVSQRRGG